MTLLVMLGTGDATIGRAPGPAEGRPEGKLENPPRKTA